MRLSHDHIFVFAATLSTRDRRVTAKIIVLSRLRQSVSRKSTTENINAEELRNMKE